MRGGRHFSVEKKLTFFIRPEIKVCFKNAIFPVQSNPLYSNRSSLALMLVCWLHVEFQDVF